MARRKSAHTTLDELRQAAGAERMKQRDHEAKLDAAKLEVERAGQAVTDAYAADDATLAAQRRKELQAAEGAVLDLQHRVDAAGLRVERAQQQLDEFQRERARDLLEERVAEAREVALKLTRGGHDLVRLHRAYGAMRTDIDSLVRAVPDAVVRNDGPPPSHPWERQLRDLERVVRESPEVEPPLPRWAGLKDREQRDRTNRLLQLRRLKRLTEAEQDELDRLSSKP